MDDHGFDDMAKSISEGGSRRAILKIAAGGGLAAMLAAIGIGGAGAANLAAERERRERRDRRHRDRRDPRKPRTPVDPLPPVDPVFCTPVTGVAVNPTGQANGTACTGGNPAACTSGFCTSTLCQPCPETCLVTTSNTQVCCPNGSFCSDGACRLPCSASRAARNKKSSK